MTKEKAPLLSLEAHGTIGSAITYQKGTYPKISRMKPELPYFLTLPVQYQRWLYQDYAYLWTQQSLATRQSYQSSGSRYHLTGFQYWMKYQLTNLPDIAGMWYLDVNTDPTTPDYSRNGNTATIIGASPATGIIGECLSFDGINDYLDCGKDPSLLTWTELTIEVMFKTTDAQFDRGLVGSRAGIVAFLWTLRMRAGFLNYEFWDSDGVTSGHRNIARADDGLWHYGAVTLGNGKIYGYMDEALGFSQNYVPTGNFNTGFPVKIGGGYPAFEYIDALIDHVIIRNRVLDQSEITRHSLRRYPA